MGAMSTDTEGEATVTAQKSRVELAREIQKSKKVWYIKNNTNAILNCNTEPPLSLGPSGFGQDVAVLPKEILTSAGIQRMWARGELTITDDPAIEEEMIEGSIQAEARQEATRKALFGDAELEEPSSNRDLVAKKCLVSGDTVYQTVAEIKNMVPPLIPAYKDRAHEFIPHVSQDERGNEVVTFSRVTIEQ